MSAAHARTAPDVTATREAPRRATVDGSGERQAELVHITTVPMSLNFLRGQVGFMQRHGLRVHAISSPGPELEPFARSEGIGVSGVPMERRITPFRDLLSIWRIVAKLRQLRPLIVHSHTPKGGLLGMIAAAVARVPVRVYHIRGLPFTAATGWRRRLLWLSEWVSCHLAHAVVCVSHSMRSEATAARICPPQRLRVFLGGSGNGVDAENRFNPDRLTPECRLAVRERYGISDDALVIGFVGRIVGDKGIVELAGAWRELREKHPELHLLMVGFFEEQDAIPKETEHLLREDPRVHLTGLDWNVAPYYAAMDLVVLPTYREGFPNVPLEAAAMALPVVATRVPGCVDAVVDEVTGILVSAKSESELKEAIERYLADHALRVGHGHAGRQRVLIDFRPEGIWRKLLEEYTSLLRERGVSERLEPAGVES